MQSADPRSDLSPAHRVPSPPTRRSLLRTAAWAAPVATIAVAAPAIAASSDVGSVRIWTGGSITVDSQDAEDEFWYLNYNVWYDGGGTSGPDFAPGTIVFTVTAPDGTTIENATTATGNTALSWDVSVVGRVATFSNKVAFPWDEWTPRSTDRFSLEVHADPHGSYPEPPTVALSPAFAKQDDGWVAATP
ncbi:hypothetical protein ACXET9_06365 [Brachybacterium sp. DNPG3]